MKTRFFIKVLNEWHEVDAKMFDNYKGKKKMKIGFDTIFFDKYNVTGMINSASLLTSLR